MTKILIITAIYYWLKELPELEIRLFTIPISGQQIASIKISTEIYTHDKTMEA